MNIKRSTIEEVLDSETKMVIGGAKRYGAYFTNADGFNELLNNFILSVDLDRNIFVAFLSKLRKHHTLALFSTVRLHSVQAMMNMRQVLESGERAAYAIANPNDKDFTDIDEQGIMDFPDRLDQKRYKWLEVNYKASSDAIRNMKKSIDRSYAHSNLANAYNTFQFNEAAGRFDTFLFDIENKRRVKRDLWMIGNVAMGLMYLFYGINKNHGVIKFIDDFIPRLKDLENQNHKLKIELRKEKLTLN